MNLAIKPIKSANQAHRIAAEFERLNVKKFISFYFQLKKLKEKRSEYRIKYVINKTYPNLSSYSLLDIDCFINAQFLNQEQ
ncbi:MAG: hypothetical protein HWD84_04065 [Flavobacteriaceae bacterium]|nr:hypothetical protein [Flavobacteriaceae bacterium]NVJ71824.1 hypothetical protein [Flavobacteriaceae bacterium]